VAIQGVAGRDANRFLVVNPIYELLS